MVFDIWDESKRQVRCMRNEDPGWWRCRDNAPALTVGKLYTVSGVHVHSWYTEVELEELPGLLFNSSLFEELDKQREG